MLVSIFALIISTGIGIASKAWIIGEDNLLFLGKRRMLEVKVRAATDVYNFTKFAYINLSWLSILQFVYSNLNGIPRECDN